MRQRLVQLMNKMEGNDKLEELLGQVLNNTDAARKLAEQMGIDAGKPAGEAPQPPRVEHESRPTVRKYFADGCRNCKTSLLYHRCPSHEQC